MKRITLFLIITIGLAFYFAKASAQTVTDIDGNIYPVITIGEQEWMGENLRVSRYRNGDPILNNPDNTFWQTSSEGLWEYYDRDPANDLLYGKLYNWHATIDNRGLCPTGWRVARDIDWQIILEYIDPNAWGNNNNLGIKLKSRRQVNSPLGGAFATNIHPRWDSHPQRYGTDDFGFGALPGGYYTMGNAFVHKGKYSYFWSSTSASETHAWTRIMMFSHKGMSRTQYQKKVGLSVRCIKGDESEASIPIVQTLAVSEIGENFAVSGGDVINDGGMPITARGILWSHSLNPTIEQHVGITSDGDGSGQFISELTGLIPGKTYYARAYAINVVGTGYGNNVHIETYEAEDIHSCMVAWYHFNGNANDASGNNFNGNVYGATLTTDRFGNENSAYSFNGMGLFI